MQANKITITSGTSGSVIALHSRSRPPEVPIISSTTVLTKEQKQTAILVMQGWSNEKIGQFLYLSEKSVDCRLTKLFRLLGVKNRIELMACLEKNPQLMAVPRFKSISATRREIALLKEQRLKAALILTSLVGEAEGGIKSSLQNVPSHPLNLMLFLPHHRLKL